MKKERTAEPGPDNGSRKGGYEAGPTLISELPPPPNDLGVGVQPDGAKQAETEVERGA